MIIKYESYRKHIDQLHKLKNKEKWRCDKPYFLSLS